MIMTSSSSSVIVIVGYCESIPFSKPCTGGYICTGAVYISKKARSPFCCEFSQGVQVHREYLSLWEMLGSLGSHLATFHALVRQVEKILYTPKRASSLVESFNSTRTKG